MRVFLALVAASGWGASTVFAGLAARRGSVLSLTMWSQLLGFLVALPVLFVVGTSSVNPHVLLLGAAAGGGVAVSLFFLYLSTRYLYVGVASALSALVACTCPVLYSWVHRPLTAETLAGVVVCLLAISVVARWRHGAPAAANPGESRYSREATGIAAAMFSGLGLSVYYVCLAGTSVHSQLWEALGSRLVSAVLLGLVAVLFARGSVGFSLVEIKSAAPVAVVGMIASLAYASAVTAGSLAVVVPSPWSERGRTSVSFSEHSKPDVQVEPAWRSESSAMAVVTRDPAIEILRALADPIRLDIMTRIVSADELACTTLEKDLPISKSTISYHMKILYRAGLVDIRKVGRFYFYRARRSELDERIPGLQQWLADRPRPKPKPK